jgi:hypothetical protein
MAQWYSLSNKPIFNGTVLQCYYLLQAKAEVPGEGISCCLVESICKHSSHMRLGRNLLRQLDIAEIEPWSQN